jgi:two-component system sensor histidine kinase KdpD
LKTPLTSLRASASALLTDLTGLSANQRELLSIVDEETHRLNLLVSEVLNMARIEAGKLRLNREAWPAETLIRDAVENAGRVLEGRKVEVRLASGLQPVIADAELILTVLRHLLDNAAKYSSPGEIIRISAEPENHQVRVSVADQGPGLSEQELSQVFEKYYRGPRTRDAVPGIGMGLAIARDIIVAHGGRIWAESSPGQGARFSFTLPVAGKGRQA